MDFFTHQDKARSTTRKLVVLFICAIAFLIAVTSFFVVTLLYYVEDSADGGSNLDLINSQVFLQVSIAVIVIVALGAQFRFLQLRGGGKSVAEAMGGRLLNLSSRDADERRILNVVEEMAIASGLPVPPVYLIDDQAINAFAAGYQQKDAVIGITRGCIQQLSREELQGVIAHEFSHIFNGDMRLNIRLIGLLYGIMVIGMIGYFIMRGNRYSYAVSRNKKGGGIVMLGIGLAVIGYGGTFFGNMIKAAVSRQREFLADASAVQFTRNPDGISGALQKIGGYGPGSKIASRDVSEISHMLFGEGISAGFTGLFATHPPLKDRIRKIDPHWQGEFIENSNSSKSTASTNTSNEQVSGFSGNAETSASPQTVIESIGNPSAEHLNQAITQLGQIADEIKNDAHTTFGACALMYSLLLACSESPILVKQLAALEAALTPKQFSELGLVQKRVKGLNRDLYLTLIDLALPSLKQLSSAQSSAFMKDLTQLIIMDEHVSLFEWSLYQILSTNLVDGVRRSGRLIDLEKVADECEVLLTVLAEAGHDNEAQALTSFSQAKDLLRLQQEISFKEEHLHSTQTLEKAVAKLSSLKPLQKPFLLKAMVKCIDADGQVTAQEGELLRAVASLIDCPIPPLLSGQKFI